MRQQSRQQTRSRCADGGCWEDGASTQDIHRTDHYDEPQLHAKPCTMNATTGVTAAGTAGGAAAATASAAAVVASAGAAAAAGAGAAGTTTAGAVSDAVSDAVSAADDTGAAGVAGASASAAIAIAAAVRATSRDGARACCELQPLMWVSYTLAFQAFRRRYKFKPKTAKGTIKRPRFDLLTD